MVGPDRDVPEVASMQPALVGDRADDRAGHHLVPLAHRNAIGSKVAAPFTRLAWPVITRPAVGSFASLLWWRLGHQKLFAVAALQGECGGDIGHRHVVIALVALDQLAE